MLLRNSFLNLIGLGGPLLAAVFSIPYLIDELGVERFGLLTLIWAVVSYFGLFDFGLGRALTQQVAVACAQDKCHDLPSITGTAYSIMLVFGLCAGLTLDFFAPVLVSQIKNVPSSSEAVSALHAMAIAMPFIVLTSGFRGVLEAKHAFGIINLIRLPMGFFTFLGPAAAVWLVEARLDLIAWVLVIGRVLGCIVHAWFAVRCLPEKYRKLVVDRAWVRPLCVSGGWLTVSNIISPLMGYVDRLMIGALVSAAAIAYYATPNEIVTKLWIIPGALTAVLFPTFAAQIARGDGDAQGLFKSVLLWLLLAMTPVVAVLILFAHEILQLWISKEFASQSATILRILAAGIFVNSLAHIPFTVIQSGGKAHLTAKIHLCEFPLFMLVLWWLTAQYGTIGAACAWLLRMFVDTALMFRYALPIVGLHFSSLINVRFLMGIAVISLVLMFGVGSSVAVRLTAVLVFLIITAVTLFNNVQAYKPFVAKVGERG